MSEWALKKVWQSEWCIQSSIDNLHKGSVCKLGIDLGFADSGCVQSSDDSLQRGSAPMTLSASKKAACRVPPKHAGSQGSKSCSIVHLKKLPTVQKCCKSFAVQTAPACWHI